MIFVESGILGQGEFGLEGISHPGFIDKTDKLNT